MPLEKNSPADRITEYIRMHPQEQMALKLIAAKLMISPSIVRNVMQPAVDLGLLVEMNVPYIGASWVAGPKLIMTKMASPEQTKQIQPKIPKTMMNKLLPALDISKLTISSSLPVPPARWMARGETRHDSIFDELTTDGMSITGIPQDYFKSISYAAKRYLSLRPELSKTIKFIVCRTAPTECGIWRERIQK